MTVAYISFKEVGALADIKAILNWHNISYQETKNELKGEMNGQKFIASKQKNLFFCPGGEDKGGTINLVSFLTGENLRKSAELIMKQFGEKEIKRAIPDLNLVYEPSLEAFGLTEELCQEFECGLCRQKSVMAGKVTFAVRNKDGEKTGYIGYEPKKRRWYFPKMHKQDSLYRLNKVQGDEMIITVSPFDVIHLHKLGFDSVGLMSNNMTEAQENLLNFKKVLILHHNGDNVALRLSHKSYVKCLVIDDVRQLTAEDVNSAKG